jgi:hypothetical protein
LSSSRDSNIGGDARRASDRREECVSVLTRGNPSTPYDAALSDTARLTPIVLAVAGLALFIIAAAAGSHVLYGTADLLVGGALALFATWPQPTGVHSVAAVRGGLGLAAAVAVFDGVLTLSNHVGTVTNVLTWVIVAGVVIAILGRGLRT